MDLYGTGRFGTGAKMLGDESPMKSYAWIFCWMLNDSLPVNAEIALSSNISDQDICF